MAGEIVPLSCALRFKPPTLILLYKDLQTGKNRKRSMPLRGLTGDTSLPSYTTRLLHSSSHAAYVDKIPPNQLESLLQRVRDAQIKPGFHTTTIMPSLTNPSHGDSGSPAHGSVQPSSTGGTNAHSDSDGKKLEHLKIRNAGDRLKPQVHVPDPPKSSPDLAGLPAATTTTLYGRRLSPLGPAGAGQGKLTTSGEAVVNERNGAEVRAGDSTLSSVVLTKLSSAQSRGVEASSASRHNESQQQSKCRKSLPGTFSTEVPDYSDDFSSDSEALPSSHTPAEGGEQFPWQPPQGGGKSPLAEDTSLSFDRLSVSCSSLHAGDLSADQDFDLSSSSSLVGRNFSPSAIVTGDNSRASGNEEDLNKASDKHLGKRKAQMDVLFEANRLRPGDKGYVYDKEVEFGQPKIESGWDSDSSCSDF